MAMQYLPTCKDQRIALKLVYHHGQYFLPVVAICGPFWDYLWLNDVISGGAFCWLVLPAGLSFGNWMLISKQYVGPSINYVVLVGGREVKN